MAFVHADVDTHLFYNHLKILNAEHFQYQDNVLILITMNGIKNVLILSNISTQY